MRTLTPAMIQAITGQETSEVFIVLVTISHALLGANPLRFSSDPSVRVGDEPLLYKTVSRGNDYFFVPMDVTLPDDAEGSKQSASLAVSNVGQEQTVLLRSVPDPASVLIEIVLLSDPDTVGFALPALDLTTAHWDELTVTLQLTIEALDLEPYPTDNFSPGYFPSLQVTVQPSTAFA